MSVPYPIQLELAEKTYNFIADPRNWSATGANRRHDKYCALQALDHIAEGMPNPSGFDLADPVSQRLDEVAHAEFLDGPDIIDVNDNHGHWAVCRCYRRVVRELREALASGE